MNLAKDCLLAILAGLLGLAFITALVVARALLVDHLL